MPLKMATVSTLTGTARCCCRERVFGLILGDSQRKAFPDGRSVGHNLRIRNAGARRFDHCKRQNATSIIGRPKVEGFPAEEGWP